MYKTTQDAADYISRVASHSTKPSRRGIIKDIPAWAKEPEEYYNSLLDQYDAATSRLHDLRERVIWLKKQLKNRLPFEEYTRLQHEYDFAAPQLSDLEISIGQLRLAARAAAKNAWGAVFYHLCESSLDRETFKRIDVATQELLQREHQQLGKPHSEKSTESKRIANKKTTLKKRFKTFREAYAAGVYQKQGQREIKR